jgi:hypothetical protein
MVGCMSEDDRFPGWAFKCEGDSLWQLMFHDRDGTGPAWYLMKAEDRQEIEDVDAQRWFDPDAATIEAWLLTNGVPEEAATSIVDGIEEQSPPGWQGRG